MRNLPLTERRCKGADDKFNPTICPRRNSCQRHRQLVYDRQLELPADITATIPVMRLAYVPGNSCTYFVEAV